MTEAAGAIIEIRDLAKRYGAVAALDGVSFAVAPGEFLTLLGPSGSGKTTTLMSIAGFVRPSEGEILYEGRNIVGEKPERRGFGMVFQGYALFPHMTVEENVRFPLEIRGLPAAEIRRRVGAALEKVQLAGLARRLPRALSGGQQQRVALARALVYQPKVLLLDEPLSALDKKLRADLQWELKSLHRDLGTSFLYVTHDQEEALSLSDRIAIFEKGKIAQIGNPEDLYERPLTAFVASFLGRSNLFPAKILAVRGDAIEIEFEGGRLALDGASRSFAPGEAAMVAIRPHKVAIGRAHTNGGTAGLAGVVAAASYAGTTISYLVRTGSGTPIYVEAPVEDAAARLADGDAVELRWRPEHLRLLHPS